MPYPRAGEDKPHFVSRFMESSEARESFPEDKQRAAVAYSLSKHRDNAVATHICGECGGRLNVADGAASGACGACGREQALVPTERLPNLCPTCRHELSPLHDDLGCNAEACDCSVNGASELDVIESALMRNALNDLENARTGASEAWERRLVDRAKLLREAGVADASLAGKAWAELPPEVQVKIQDELGRHGPDGERERANAETNHDPKNGQFSSGGGSDKKDELSDFKLGKKAQATDEEAAAWREREAKRKKDYMDKDGATASFENANPIGEKGSPCSAPNCTGEILKWCNTCGAGFCGQHGCQKHANNSPERANASSADFEDCDLDSGAGKLVGKDERGNPLAFCEICDKPLLPKGQRTNAAPSRADILKMAEDFKANGASRASAHDALNKEFPGMGGDVRMVVDDIWPLHEGHRSNSSMTPEEARAVLRDLSIGMPDTGAIVTSILSDVEYSQYVQAMQALGKTPQKRDLDNAASQAAFDAHAKECAGCANALEAGKPEAMCEAGQKLVKSENSNGLDYGGRAPEFIAWLKRTATANGKSEAELLALWKDYTQNASAITSEFMRNMRLKGSDMWGRENANAAVSWWCLTEGKAVTPEQEQECRRQGHQTEMLPPAAERANASEQDLVSAHERGDHRGSPTSGCPKCHAHQMLPGEAPRQGCRACELGNSERVNSLPEYDPSGSVTVETAAAVGQELFG